MVVRVDITHNIEEVRALLRTNRTDQIPYANALALNRTIERTKAYLVGRLPQVFDRPTPYTLNAFRTTWATKTTQRASIAIKDEAVRGTPAERYLKPEIEGGERNLKRSERALQAAGLMPLGTMAVPGAGAEIDQYGNMRAAQIIALLAALQALSGTPYTSAAHVVRKRGRYRTAKYFVPPVGGHLKPGVYQRLGPHHVIPVLLFVPRFTYTARFDFTGEASRYASSIYNEELTRAWSQALATAR